MPSGPKKRRAARNKNVLLSVKLEEGSDVKIEPFPVQVHEPVAVKIEPVFVEAYEPVVEPPVVSLVEPVAELPEPVVGLVEPVAEPPVVSLAEPVAEPFLVGLDEPVVESALVEPVAEPFLVGLDEPVVESAGVGLVESAADLCGPVVGLDEPFVESFVPKASSTDSCEVELNSINGEELFSVNELAYSEEAIEVMTEESRVVQKVSVNGGDKSTTKVELGEVKKSIQQQLRVVEQLTVNLRQILANLD